MILKDKKSVREYLTAVVNESLRNKRLTEDDATVQPTNNPPPAQSDAQNDKTKLQSADIAVDDVVDKLNTIRSGRSFKDSAVKGSLEKYIGDLEPAERTALYAFLKGIVQIVTGEVPGEVATEPADKPANVEMEKEPTVKKRSVKPNVIRTASVDEPATTKTKQTKAAPSGAEDTSSPLPVTPKKRSG